MAAGDGHVKAMQLLINLDYNLLQAKDTNGATVLNLAVQSGHIKAGQSLLLK